MNDEERGDRYQRLMDLTPEAQADLIRETLLDLNQLPVTMIYKVTRAMDEFDRNSTQLMGRVIMEVDREA